MSSPSPGPNLGGASILSGGVSRRVSTGFMGGGIGPTAPPRPLTPPIVPQHSPNSFLQSLSSRLISQKRSDAMRERLPMPANDFDMDIRGQIGSNAGNILGFRSHNFGVVGGQIGGPPSALDLSEFPTLGGASSNSLFAQSNAGQRPAYVGMVKDNVTSSVSNNEFTIHNEDFPALPGSNTNFHSGSNALDTPTQSSALTAMSLGAGNTAVMGPQGTLMNVGGQGDGAPKVKRGIQTNKEGRVTNIPGGMVTDQFGMVGLLTFIRASESDPNLVSLALGTDLTTLGLNLNSSDNLYSSFGGPWSDQPLRPPEIDYSVPSEYLINANIREKLAAIKLSRYGDDLLFFLFYMFPGDLIQVAAASELYVRDWRYHKDERVWITRAPGMPPMEKTTTYERGTYYFFDVHNWRKIAKEFHLDYERLENRPAAAAFTNPAGVPA